MTTEDNANPQGSDNPEPMNIEAAFENYLSSQANPGSDDDDEQKQPTEADNSQSDQTANQDEIEPADPAEQLFKVTVQGEEKEIPLSELLKGYQLESDYRIKTSQIAEQARAAQAQMQQAQQLQAQYAQQLQAYSQQLQSMQPQPPDPNLIASDPVGFLQQQQAYQAWQAQVQQVQFEQQQLTQAQQQQQAAAIQAKMAEQQSLLLKAIPDWADESKAKAGKTELASYLQKIGFNPDEIASAHDHRAIVMARKAMLYDQLQSKQSQVNQKVANLPPKPPQRPGTGSISPTDGRTRAMQNLKKTGSVDAAAHAFAAYLGGN